MSVGHLVTKGRLVYEEGYAESSRSQENMLHLELRMGPGSAPACRALEGRALTPGIHSHRPRHISMAFFLNACDGGAHFFSLTFPPILTECVFLGLKIRAPTSAHGLTFIIICAHIQFFCRVLNSQSS